jgi:hypothetical protein
MVSVISAVLRLIEACGKNVVEAPIYIQLYSPLGQHQKEKKEKKKKNIQRWGIHPNHCVQCD